MSAEHSQREKVTQAEAVIASLEPEQLSSAKAHHYSRRKLGRTETGLLWLLRVYVLFMMVVVVFQILTGR